MKLPAIQFYPGDWHKDQGVQALDLEHRGAWFEMLLMMHDSDERGVLLVNGLPMPEDVIARRLGLVNQKFNQILTTLLNFGVASKRESDGAIFCRRMVRDENLRKIRTEAGKKGGNPNLVNQKSKQKPTTGVKQISTPSITSSITTTKESTIPAGSKEPSKYEAFLKVFNDLTKRNFRTLEAKTKTQFDKLQKTGYKYPDFVSAITNGFEDSQTWLKPGLFTPEYITREANFTKYLNWQSVSRARVAYRDAPKPYSPQTQEEQDDLFGGVSEWGKRQRELQKQPKAA